MAKQHSLGPWRVIRASDYTNDPANTTVHSIQSADGKTVYYTESGYFKPQEADVALIAAAPDLLAALRAVVTLFPETGDSPYARKVIAQVDAAIDKAVITKAAP